MRKISCLTWEKIAKETKLDKKSIQLRMKILDVVNVARRGHVGSAFSSIDIVRVLYDYVLHFNPKNPLWEDRDRFIFSKGHGCLSLYTVLAQKGFFPEKELFTFCKFGSKFGGHPQYGKVPGVEASTGSLGHGLSIALGIALALKIKYVPRHCEEPATTSKMLAGDEAISRECEQFQSKLKQVERLPRPDLIGARNDNRNRNSKLKNDTPRVFVLLSDGECNEGSTWEAVLAVGKHKLDNLLILVDYNKMQSYGNTYEVLDLEPFKNKWENFGFKVREVNGHDVPQLKSCIKSALKNLNGPTVIICHTIKGKGVPFIEQNPSWHHKNMITDEEMERLYRELRENVIPTKR